MKNIAYGILTEARESRNNFKLTGSEFDKIKANMYSILECYAHGIIGWDQSKQKLQHVIKEYIKLYPKSERNAEREIMREEYKRISVQYKVALDRYKTLSEQKLTTKLVDKKQLDESVAKNYSATYYNERILSESDLKDISTLKTWERVMEAYPNLTAKDEDRVRMLTIFEGPTVDTTQMITTVMKEGPNDNIGRRERAPNGQMTGSTRGFDTDHDWFNPRAGHMDQPSHPQNRGLAPASSPRPRLRPDNLTMRSAINKAIRQAMGEGWEELPPMPARYQERDGLEGPIMTRSGKVVYYDPKAGSYYDPDTDMYISYDDWRMLDKKGMHMVGKVKESARGLGSIDWPDVDEDGDSAMAQHAENAIRHGMHAYDAYDHVYSMSRERDWLSDNKDMIIDMFAQYGLQTESAEKRWKQTSMSPEAAAKEFGKENVRVKKGALRNGDDMVEVFVEGALDDEIAAYYRQLKLPNMKSWKKLTRQESVNEWGGDDQYQAIENFVDQAAEMFFGKLEDGESQKSARADAHDMLKGELGDLGVVHGDMESQEAHNMLEKELIRIMNYFDYGRKTKNEGHSPHKKGTEKYRKHMAAMHAEADEKNVSGFDARTIKALADLKVDYPHAPDTLSAILRALEDVKRASKREDHTHERDIDKLEKRVNDLEKDHTKMATEDMSDDEIDAFHRALDALVHKHLGHSSDEVDERKMTKAEKSKEKRLKKKYDDSDMKASMKKQYGDDWENVYFATIRKKAMEQFNEMTSAGAVATVAQPMGKIIKRKKTNEGQYDASDIMYEDPPIGIDFDFDNLPKVDWSKYSKEDIEKFVDHLENLDFEDGVDVSNTGYSGSYRKAANWVEKNVLSKHQNESLQMMTEAEFDEAAGEKDACYHKVKSRYKVWPSAYASGALVKCRKVGAKNWGKSKK